MSDQPTVEMLNAESFSLEVERRYLHFKMDSYIEATSELLEELDVDPDDVKHLFSPTLIAKIQAEASRNGLLKEKNQSTDLLSFFGA